MAGPTSSRTCVSDALDPNVMPEDLDGDGLCDVLQILLVGDFEPPEPGFCTDGEITGGNGLMGQDVYTELVVIEKTGGTYQYQYEIHDWTNELHEDLQQDASNHDFRGYYDTTTSSCPTLMGPSTRTAASSPSKRVPRPVDHEPWCRSQHRRHRHPRRQRQRPVRVGDCVRRSRRRFGQQQPGRPSIGHPRPRR